MKTDEFFYMIFRRRPELLFELLGLPREDDYLFESVEVKHTKKRIDGLFVSQQGKAPNVFAEFQGYKDKTIYWRTLRQVATWYEQHPDDKSSFRMVILFLNRNLDPGPPKEIADGSCPLTRAYLPECLSRISGKTSPLVVLEPLVLEDASELRERAPSWKGALRDLNLEEKDRIFWVELLEYAVIQRFPSLTMQEIRKMLQMTPLEETVAGKQLIAMGISKGIQEGIQKGIQKGKLEGIQEGKLEGLERGLKKGELVGGIRAYQSLLHIQLTPRRILSEMSLDELQLLLANLNSQLQDLKH
jgi:predicted transposase YdaD